MKFALFFSAVLTMARATKSGSALTGDRIITRIVKRLQTMVDKSKADGDEERILYGKYKCYCDNNEADKKASIESLGEQINVLSNGIDGLQAGTGLLSSEVAKLDVDMAANVAAREKAQAARVKAKQAFLAMESDSEQAIQQMVNAIDVLTNVGADQTLKNAAADHDQFMSGHKSLIKLRSVVRQALLAASSVTNAKQALVVESFLQAPGAGFTGTYAAQAGEVVGILKDMRDTFTASLAAARATEKAEAEAHEKLRATVEAAHAKMSDAYEMKQDQLVGNDHDLSDKKAQLEMTKEAKSDDENFLANLLEMCAAKAKDYDERVLLRRNEEAALAEAISILNSDAAFATFGTEAFGKVGLLQRPRRIATSFLQRRSVQEHVRKSEVEGPRRKAESLIETAMAGQHSLALSRVLDALGAGNPFAIVLREIEKMLGLIEKEENVDRDQLAWCNEERKTNNENLGAKEEQIVGLNGAITELDKVIDGPVDGLKVTIEQREIALQTNRQDQATETTHRKETNSDYQTDVSNLVEAERVIETAIGVLKKYYSKFWKQEESASSLVQTHQEPPKTWENDSYKGQSAQGGDAVQMLEFILGETKKQEEVAHQDEQDAQQLFEQEMTRLTTEERNAEEALVSMRDLLAQNEQDLLEKQTDLKKTEAEKAAIEAYLLEIKPGCDFITTHMDHRNSSRETEKGALINAQKLLEGTPAYQTAMTEAHNESLDECLDECYVESEDNSKLHTAKSEHVKCKACLAKVTIPAYCAGHPGTEGCD